MWKKKQSAFKPSNSKEMNGNDDSKEQLIAQVEHYKGVLGETVCNNFALGFLQFHLLLIQKNMID